MGHRMHLEGPQMYQMNRQINSFQNVCDMLWAKIDSLTRKIDSLQKNITKSPILVCPNLSYPSLERQTVDPTFRDIPLDHIWIAKICIFGQICICGRSKYGQVGCPSKDLAKCS